ncbi:MAG: PD-(D/E)XK nuclease family protein, partial [Desulfobacteraceae bacterium]|nr:PD-(D/E)XK nuclease family protein [Desulfobacteraceae bacterium]
GAELVTPEMIERGVPLALSEAGLGRDVKGLWPVLPELYKAWIGRLDRAGFWTRGEIYRLAALQAARLTKGEGEVFKKRPWLDAGTRGGRVYLAGFYALTKAEEEVFSALLGLGCATVVAYEESGPNPRPFLHQGHDLHSQIFKAQGLCRDTASSRQGDEGGGCCVSMAPDEEAIVLPNADALIPVLEWLVGTRRVQFNISMGYPLKNTPAAQLLILVLDAQDSRERGSYHITQYLNVLRHPYVKGLKPSGAAGASRPSRGLLDAPPSSGPDLESRGGLSPVDESFRETVHWIEGWTKRKRPVFVNCEEVADAYLKETGNGPCASFLRHVHQRLFSGLEGAASVGDFASRLKHILCLFTGSLAIAAYPLAGDFISELMEFVDSFSSGPLSLEPMTPNGFRFLFTYLLREARIPFSGIPLDGLQVLGMLETRCLNFKKVMVFDVNEGVFPPEDRPEPILPPGLRRVLGLPGRERAVDISRHYLRRLISAAGEAHLFFAEGKDRIRSRFIEEIIWEEEKKTSSCGYKVEKEEAPYMPPVIYRPVLRGKEGLADRLSSFVFSASTIDTYLNCPFRFYAAYILGVKEERPGNEDELDPAVIGTLVHRILKRAYEPWLDKEIRLDGDAEGLLAYYIDEVLKEEFGPEDDLSVTVRLFREVVFYRLTGLLRLEQGYQGARFLMGLEKGCEAEIIIPRGKTIRLKGVLDRIERDADGTFWVIDYKTGGDLKLPSGELRGFGREEMKKTIGSFQLPVYLILCDRMFGLKGDWTRLNAA